MVVVVLVLLPPPLLALSEIFDAGPSETIVAVVTVPSGSSVEELPFLLPLPPQFAYVAYIVDEKVVFLFLFPRALLYKQQRFQLNFHNFTTVLSKESSNN